MGMVHQNQFVGLPIENSNLHFSIFVEVCGTLKMNNVDLAIIILRLFPFSFEIELEHGCNPCRQI